VKIKDLENIWIEKLEKEIKSFPEDFTQNVKTKRIKMPGKDLIKGSELFGSYEIADIEGNTFFQTKNSYELKYILYANKNKPTSIKIPTNEDDIETVVKSYEKYLDELLKNINTNYKKHFANPVKLHSVINKIFSLLNLKRY
jgi:hypothetical protein